MPVRSVSRGNMRCALHCPSILYRGLVFWISICSMYGWNSYHEECLKVYHGRSLQQINTFLGCKVRILDSHEECMKLHQMYRNWWHTCQIKCHQVISSRILNAWPLHLNPITILEATDVDLAAHCLIRKSSYCMLIYIMCHDVLIGPWLVQWMHMAWPREVTALSLASKGLHQALS